MLLKTNRHLVQRSSANFPFHPCRAPKSMQGRRVMFKEPRRAACNQKDRNRRSKGSRAAGAAIATKKEGIFMRRVIVKKRRLEKEFNNLKLVFVVYDVCEVTKNEDGSTEINISQIYDVLDVWDFQDFNELFA